MDIPSEICPLLVSLFLIYNYKYNATVCSSCISKSVKPKCFHLHVKAKDRNLRDHFIHLYSNSSWRTIKVNLETKCYYEFISALGKSEYTFVSALLSNDVISISKWWLGGNFKFRHVVISHLPPGVHVWMHPRQNEWLQFLAFIIPCYQNQIVVIKLRNEVWFNFFKIQEYINFDNWWSIIDMRL